MKCFLSGSIHDDGATTLVALAASSSFWDTFHLRWDTMVLAHTPRVDALQAPAIPESLLLDAVTLLDNLDKWTFRAFACTLDSSAHPSLPSEWEEVATVCAESSAGQAIRWYEDTHPVESVQLFLSKEPAVLGSLRASWLKHHRHKHGVDQELFGGKVEEITSVDLPAHPPLQAAGLIAWALAHPQHDIAELLIGDDTQPGAVALTRLQLGEPEIHALHHGKKRHSA